MGNYVLTLFFIFFALANRAADINSSNKIDNSSPDVDSPKFVEKLSASLQQKSTEYQNNTAFFRENRLKEHKLAREPWAKFMSHEEKQIRMLETCGIKWLEISGVKIAAHNLADREYAFLVHTTELDEGKAKALIRYVKQQNQEPKLKEL